MEDLAENCLVDDASACIQGTTEVPESFEELVKLGRK